VILVRGAEKGDLAEISLPAHEPGDAGRTTMAMVS
jgi:hypothetical protein